MDFMISPTPVTPTAVTPTRHVDSGMKEDQAGLVHSHGVFTQTASHAAPHGPALVTRVSTPAYESPLRHHQRGHSRPRQVKESLNARSEYVTSHDDGSAEHRINQYVIKQEIGRGSFGAVHLAVDQYGAEYAVKEFSKSRLRKRAQSHILRKPRALPKQVQLAARGEFNSPLHRNPSGDSSDPASGRNAIDLIKAEIAIMKKLNHPNLCCLYEVLDDPREDSLYMVMEMCKKGIIMKVGLDQKADPYDDESCRCWFRDLILGIEYLHAQGIVHRDIKPDNCLLTDENVLKVVDFGVSEMFEKDSEMLTAKSAGSPAFLPPELCVVKHGDISGKSADIWSMGVTLYCLRYGRIPFEKSGILELYEAIKADEPSLEGETDPDFRDLIHRILEKDATKRIKMHELREHPWVTRQGTDPLFSEAENTAELIGPPTAAEVETAITGNVGNLLTVMKAVKKFKRPLARKRPPVMSSILGENDPSRFSLPPLAIRQDAQTPRLLHKSQSVTVFDRQAIQGALAVEGVHASTDLLKGHPRDEINQAPNCTTAPLRENDGDRSIAVGDTPGRSEQDSERSLQAKLPGLSTGAEEDQYLAFRPERPAPESERAKSYDEVGHRGHARDPLQHRLYLHIGPSSFSGAGSDAENHAPFGPHGEEEGLPIVSESPGAADIDIYETAYRDEIERIRQRSQEEGKNEEETTVYLTRRVDARLLAVSQLAGRFRAKGEGGLDRFAAVTGWKDKKARVNDVSRALREAAREEYEKRRQERRQKGWPTAGQSDAAPTSTEPNANAENRAQPRRRKGSDPRSPDSGAAEPRTPFAGRAMEKGRQAKTSLKGLMGMMKERGNVPKDGDDTPEKSQ